MKKKNIITLIAAIVVLVAAVASVIIFREQIKELLASAKEKAISYKNKFTDEECRDFADI